MERLKIKEIFFASLIFLILAGIYFYYFLLNPYSIPYNSNSDLIRAYSYLRYYIDYSFKHYKQLPLWNPMVFSGIPLVAHPEAVLFYPFSLLFLIINPDFAWGWHFLLHIFLAGFFMYLFLRYAGDISFLSSLIGGVIFMFSGGFQAEIISVHYAFFLTICYTPLIFLLINLIFGKKKIIFSILLAITLAFQYLGSQPQVFLYSSLLAFLFFIYKMISLKEKNHFKIFFYHLLSGILFFGLSSIQMLPTLKFVPFSQRAGGLDFYTIVSLGSFSPQNLLDIFLHPYIGGEVSFYCGSSALLFIVLSFLNKKVKYRGFFIFLFSFLYLFSLGKYFPPFFYIFFKFFPGIKFFLYPCRILYFIGFIVAYLSAFGFRILEEKNSVSTNLIKKILFVLLGIALFFAFIYLLGKNFLLEIAKIIYKVGGFRLSFSSHLSEIKEIVIELSRNLLLLQIMVVVAFITGILFLKYTKRYLLYLLLALTILDLWSVSLGKWQFKKPSDIFVKNKLIDFLIQDKEFFRILNIGGERVLPQSIACRYNIQLADGYDQMILREYIKSINIAIDKPYSYCGTRLPIIDANLEEIKKPELLSLFNIKYLVSLKEFKDERFPLIKEFDNVTTYIQYKGLVSLKKVYLYFNPEYMKRVFFIPRIKEINELNLRDLKKNKIIEEGIKIAKYTPNEITITCDINMDGILILSEMWYPGWKVYDNGLEINLLKTEYGLRAVYLKRGYHKVNFIFKPMSYAIGKNITLITIGFIVIYLIFLFVKKLFS